jgi:hypothetical protein
MLTNQPIRPVDRDLDRRWMADDYFDLIVWYESGGGVHGFQLCYDKCGHERALTWTRKGGFRHSGIDAGESKPSANCSPILVAGDLFPVEKVRREFMARSGPLTADLRELVLGRMQEYEGGFAATSNIQHPTPNIQLPPRGRGSVVEPRVPKDRP